MILNYSSQTFRTLRTHTKTQQNRILLFVTIFRTSAVNLLREEDEIVVGIILVDIAADYPSASGHCQNRT